MPSMADKVWSQFASHASKVIMGRPPTKTICPFLRWRPQELMCLGPNPIPVADGENTLAEDSGLDAACVAEEEEDEVEQVGVGGPLVVAPNAALDQRTLPDRWLEDLFSPWEVEEAAANLHIARGNAPLAVGDETMAKRRRGLNPKMMYRNSMLRAAKEASPQGKLTPESTRRLSAEAFQRWGAMLDVERQDWLDDFKEWQSRPVVGRLASAASAQPYRTHWGGGCKRTIISPLDFFEHHRESGWPCDREVYDRDAFCATADHGFIRDRQPRASLYNLWGCGRQARNVCRLSIADTAKFDLVDRALANWIDIMGKELVDAGNVLALVRGRWRHGADEAEPVERFMWFAVMLVGAFYNPRVSEFTMCRFVNEAHQRTGDLAFPCDVYVEDMVCSMSSDCDVLHVMTSNDFVHLLVEQHKLSEIASSVAKYNIVDKRRW